MGKIECLIKLLDILQYSLLSRMNYKNYNLKNIYKYNESFQSNILF